MMVAEEVKGHNDDRMHCRNVSYETGKNHD